MNILYLCDEYPPGKHGGIGTVVQSLAREMVKLGHNVTVAGIYYWGYGGEDHFIDEGVQVYRFRYQLASKWFYNDQSLRVRGSYQILGRLGLLQWDIKRSLHKYQHFLSQLIKERSIEVVEMPDYNDYMRFCKKPVFFPFFKVPTIVKLHGSMTYFAREAGHKEPGQVLVMEQDIFNKAAVITSVSKYTADKTRSYFNIRKDIEVVYNGIETNIEIKQRDKIRDRVIFTGTLAGKKGIYQLMKAWNLVIEQKANATLWVCGKGSVKAAISLLSEKARASVVFKGHIPRKELIKHIEESCIGVFPSYAETFGLAPLECMLHRTAVIFTQRTSGPEVIEDGKDGILADPDDVERLANKILLLLDDPKLREALSNSAYIAVKKKFDIRRIALHNANVYESVIKNG